MAHVPGYFKLPPKEIGATLIFVPSYTRGLTALEIAAWARANGYGDVAYVPAKRVAEPQVNA